MSPRTIGPEIPTPDYDDPKELYAFFGLAAYCAGLLELSLVNLLASVRLSDPRARELDDSDAVFDHLHQRTFGNLLARARQIATLEPGVEALLERARGKRNYLVHHFFRTHAETALHPAGTRQMIDELRELALLFREADDAADPLWRQAWNTLGVSDEALEAEVVRLQREGLRAHDV